MMAALQLFAKPPPPSQVLPPATNPVTDTPNFAHFYSTLELWMDYWSRFLAFSRANTVPYDRKA